MKRSQLYAPTLREDPTDAEVVSHKLLLRAGYIRRVASGIYDLLPLGLRVLRKVEAVIRDEMNQAGGQELLLPMVQPAELWRESGRWEKYGKELLRIKDRHEHEGCLGPTHEEVVCDLVRRDLKSYRQLPILLYQIQAKFRDEIRPRFGLMRGREFIMKDAYSFHADEEDLAAVYQRMFAAYERIFSRMALRFKAVVADTGSIGGRRSHEFHVLAHSGEDVIVHCEACGYAANLELAQGRRKLPHGHGMPLSEVATPGASTVKEVAAFLKIPPCRLVKTVVYRMHGGQLDGEFVAACILGDDEVQETKLARLLGVDGLELADDEAIHAVGGWPGFVGPIGLRCKVILDASLKDAKGLVAGANKVDTHVQGLDVARDLPHPHFADIRTVQPGDGCVHCQGELGFSRGIEVGHIFELGTRYAEPMGVCFQDKEGKRSVATMGCYGIGVSRLLAAIVEQCHDEKGIAWPLAVAPFHLVLISIGTSSAVWEQSASLYRTLQEEGVDVLWDERAERPGVKFRDAELMGIPMMIVVGERALAEGKVEFRLRAKEPVKMVPMAAVERAKALALAS